MKKREWIDDYFVQLTAYAAAHNEMYGTEIRQGVVLMASQDGLLKDFVVCGREFDSYLDHWNAKVKEFYAIARADETVLTEPRDRLETELDKNRSLQDQPAALAEQPPRQDFDPNS